MKRKIWYAATVEGEWNPDRRTVSSKGYECRTVDSTFKRLYRDAESFICFILQPDSSTCIRRQYFLQSGSSHLWPRSWLRGFRLEATFLKSASYPGAVLSISDIDRVASYHHEPKPQGMETSNGRWSAAAEIPWWIQCTGERFLAVHIEDNIDASRWDGCICALCK